MKLTISKNNKFVKVTPAPDRSINSGLKIELSEPANEFSLPIATTDLIKGKRNYYFGKEMIGKVIKAYLNATA